MVVKDDSASQSPHHCRPPEWPVVSPGNIGVPDFKADLAYMGFYLELKIRNSSSYLVREAVLRIDGKGPGIEGQITRNGVVTSREVKVGPLFPGVDVVEEVGIGARGGINGLDFITISARAVRLTPPEQMRPAAEYPGLTAEVFEVSVDENAMDFRRREDDGLGEPRTASATSIGVRVRNSGPATVDRVRLKLTYWEEGRAGAAGSSDLYEAAEWIFDMPRKDWNPYQLPDAPDAAITPADPLLSGQSFEFTIVHYDGGPHDWAGCLDATSVEVTELRLRS